MAAQDLTSVANLKSWSSLVSTADDALLARLITAVSSFFASYCGRVFQSAAYSEVRDGTGGAKLVLRQYPVTAVASLAVDGQTIGMRPKVGQPGYVISPPRTLALAGYTFTSDVQNVEVSYTAGFATTPADLEQACIECCASWYKRKSRIDEQSKSIQGEVITFSMKDIPAAAKSILDDYVNWIPG